MNVIPILSSGTLSRDGNSWIVRLDATSPLLSEGTNVKVVLWASGEGSESEVERIARIQQLPPEVVAVALMTEGALLKP